MLKEQVIIKEGLVIEKHGGGAFKVKLENGLVIQAYVSGRMNNHKIRIYPGDRVRLEMTSYDLTKGRITYRYK